MVLRAAVELLCWRAALRPSAGASLALVLDELTVVAGIAAGGWALVLARGSRLFPEVALR